METKTYPSIPVFAGPGNILSEVGIKQPAVDIHAIINHYGFRIEVSDNPNGYAGAISFPEKLIMINETLNRPWQRFALAHMFAHAVLHRHLSNIFTETFDRLDDKKENEADLFAQDLLVPRNWYLARKQHLSESSMLMLFDVPINGLGLNRF